MKHFWIHFLAAFCTTGMFAADNPVELSDLNGKTHTPLVVKDRKAVVLVFVSPFCPTSNAFAPEVNGIANEYADHFAFYLVEADAGISVADAKKHVETFGSAPDKRLDPTPFQFTLVSIYEPLVA